MPPKLITDKFTDEQLQTIGIAASDNFDEDEGSRSDWVSNGSEYLKLFTSFLGKKNEPFENASNINLPMLAIATIQFWARAISEIVPAKEIVKVYDPDNSSPDKVARVGGHMNWQFLYQMKYFKKSMRKTMIQLPVFGSAFRKLYRDVDAKQMDSIATHPGDVVYSYRHSDFTDVRRISHVLRKHLSFIKKKVRDGKYLDWAKEIDQGSSDQYQTALHTVSDDILGVNETTNVDPKENMRVLVEQHTYLDVGSEDQVPVIVTFDKDERRALSISDRVENKKEIKHFVEYGFIPNPVGAYNLGFGILINGLNQAGNTIINEVIDAGRLANVQGGFVRKRSAISKGELTIKHGKFVEVDNMGDDLRKDLMYFDFKGPNTTLFQVLGLLLDYSKLISTVSETMSGQMPSSDTPATTVLALIEEGRKVFSTIYSGIHDSFGSEADLLFDLNRVYITDLDYYRELNDIGLPTGDLKNVKRDDYSNKLDIFPVSDPNIISRAERVLKAEQVEQRTYGDDNSSEENRYAARKYLYEMLDVPDDVIDNVLTKPAPKDLSPVEENALFIQGKSSEVLPEQDHIAHIESHEAFQETIFYEQMDANSKNIHGFHIKEHLAQEYLRTQEPTREAEAAI